VKLKNPWRELPQRPDYVLPQDRDAVEAANAKNAEKAKKGPYSRNAWRYEYHLNLLPDPYIGNLNAPVVLFSLNPGYTRKAPHDGNCNDDWWHSNSVELREAYRRNFNEEWSTYPMFFLDPIFSDNPGGRYWSHKLRELVETCGREKVAQNLVTIEFFPYHSNRFHGGCAVPSQEFARYQMRRAMARNAVVLIVRAETALLAAIPELRKYPYLPVNSPASGCVSTNNVRGFATLVTAIRGAKRQE
jgi:hypothetical protein